MKDDWQTSHFLIWDSRHHDAVKKLVKLGLFSTKDRAVKYLRGHALNPISIFNYYKANHDCYFLEKIVSRTNQKSNNGTPGPHHL